VARGFRGSYDTRSMLSPRIQALGRAMEVGLAAMRCLLYCGELDDTITYTQRCAKEIPHATFVSFPHLNHLEAFYRSDIVLPAVMKFLQSATA
jgi:hypothetical protein